MTDLNRPPRPPPPRPDLYCDGCFKYLGTMANPEPHPWYKCSWNTALVLLGISLPLGFVTYLITTLIKRGVFGG